MSTTLRKAPTKRSNVISFESAKRASTERARDIMMQEKLALQELSREFYLLLLDEYRQNVSNDNASQLDLQLLLDMHIEQGGYRIQRRLHNNKVEQFSYKYRLTIEQYCRLQIRLRDFPTSLSDWQKLNQQAKQFIKSCS